MSIDITPSEGFVEPSPELHVCKLDKLHIDLTSTFPPSVAEFVPYVFQVMSLLLEIHTSSIPNSYMALFPHLLQPVLWERTGNIPPLVRLLQAYLEKGAATIASSAADKIVSNIWGHVGGNRTLTVHNIL